MSVAVKWSTGLAAVVRDSMRTDPFSGVVYVFRAKRADRVKLIFWDGSGVVLVSTDVRNWTLFDNENWTPWLGFGCPGSMPGWFVQVVHRRDPRARDATATSLAARRVGGTCAPTWVSLAHADAAALSTAGAFSSPERRFSRSR